MSLPDSSTILPRLPQGSEILIIRLRSLGDVVMLTPSLAALHAWRPDLRICVLVEPAFAAVLEGSPAVHETLIHRGFLNSARRLRARKFPVTFNQHAGPTSAFLTAAIGSPDRVTWAGRQFGFLYNVRAPGTRRYFGERHVHTVEHRITQFYWTGMPRGPIPPARIFPQGDAAASVRLKLMPFEIVGHTKYAVMHPGAAYFTKRWNMQEFVALARWLDASRGLSPVIILGPGDREIAAEVKQAFGEQVAVLESLSLRELIALIAGARLFVGNDSGPAHLATASGIPVAVIFGSSDSVTWRPWQTPHRVIQNEFPCNPCRGDRCYAFPEPRCILSVTSEQVRAACAELLDDKTPRLQILNPAIP
ncbi:MAG: glycosyltransferase family 9 protein [Acidobacteria bacterium]|nr:glycosyltransferase family 9 protein [Acidobacteriota bacterium]